MSRLDRYIAERYPWLTRTRAVAGAFAIVLLIVAIWPHAHVVGEFVIATAIPGSIGAVGWALTYWSRARVEIGRRQLRYKSVRRIAGVAALACLPFLLTQRASIYLRSPHPFFSASDEDEHLHCYVAVARLEGDDGNRIGKQLLSALGSIDRRFFITPVILDRTIPVSGRAEENQHIEAITSIGNPTVRTLLWGGAKGDGSSAIGPLYHTALFGDAQFGGVFRPADFKLPELPLDELSVVLQLVVATATARSMEVWAYKFGDALEPLIKQVREMAKDPRKTSAWSPDTRARVNLTIGIALRTSAIEFLSEDSFRQAIAYFQATQTDWTREKNPLEWAMVQQNLGSTLCEVSILNLQASPLHEALTAHQNALAVYQAHSDQIDSANAQYLMGIVFQHMADHEAGTDSLRRAVDCYRTAIKGIEGKRYPFLWAAANKQLGTTLNALADRDGNSNEYEQAMAAFQAALRVYNWDLSLEQWADTQVELAESLQLLGEARSNADDLKQSIALSRQALEGFRRDSDPRRWAAIQATIGNELLSLNDIQPNPSYPEEAAAAFRDSLAEQSFKQDPMAWATAQDALGNALVAMGEASSDTAYFEQAIDAFNNALKVFRPDREPVPWARAKSDLGDALSDLGARGSGIRYLSEAVDNYHEALTVLTKDKLPSDWHKTQYNLGIALDELKQRGWKGS